MHEALKTFAVSQQGELQGHSAVLAPLQRVSCWAAQVFDKALCASQITIDFPIIADPTREIAVKCVRSRLLHVVLTAISRLHVSARSFPARKFTPCRRERLRRYGMLDPNIKDKEGLPLTCRAVFIIGPDKKLKLSLNYPASVGRNMDEIVRVVDALQLSAKYSVVRPPAGWNRRTSPALPLARL